MSKTMTVPETPAAVETPIEKVRYAKDILADILQADAVVTLDYIANKKVAEKAYDLDTAALDTTTKKGALLLAMAQAKRDVTILEADEIRVMLLGEKLTSLGEEAKEVAALLDNRVASNVALQSAYLADAKEKAYAEAESRYPLKADSRILELFRGLGMLPELKGVPASVSREFKRFRVSRTGDILTCTYGGATLYVGNNLEEFKGKVANFPSDMVRLWADRVKEALAGRA